MSAFANRIVRRLLTAALVGAVVIGGFSVGLAASAFTYPSYRGIELVALPDAGLTPQLPSDVLSPIAVLRADGSLVGLGPTGYAQLDLPPATTKALFANLSADARIWADAYPLAGRRATARVELRLVGPSPRTITIDDPLQNPSLPDALFRLVATLLRPSGAQPVGTATLDPPAIRVRALPLGPGEPATNIESAPAWLDPVAAQQPSGQRLAGSMSTSAQAMWPPLAALEYPDNSRPVTVAGTTMRLAWGADWTSWIEENR